MKSKRSRAREHVVQALYQWQLTGQGLGAIDARFLEEEDKTGCDLGYFKELLSGIPAHLRALDENLAPLLDRPIAQVDPVERAILRLGAYELLYRPDVPFRVAIDEAVELAKLFGASEGHRYVNGVLDRLARRARQNEATGGR